MTNHQALATVCIQDQHYYAAVDGRPKVWMCIRCLHVRPFGPELPAQRGS